MRLRRVSCDSPGITRVRRGRGFGYTWPDGTPVGDPAVVQRIRDLSIPPAWTDVWVCRRANGHLQAVGTDAKGRRQYLYHAAWREQRDRAKHERVLRVARRLPPAREVVAGHLAERGPGRDRVLACTFLRLDLGFVDPRVVDLFHDGRTIAPALARIGEGASPDAPATHGAVERAVLRLLS